MKLRSSKKYFRPATSKKKAKGRVKKIKHYDQNITIKKVDYVINGDVTIINICNIQNIIGENGKEKRVVCSNRNVDNYSTKLRSKLNKKYLILGDTYFNEIRLIRSYTELREAYEYIVKCTDANIVLRSERNTLSTIGDQTVDSTST